jgi:PAS domain S-box-containing protein
MILWEVEDQNTKIIDWNNASEKIFGWSKNEAVNRNFFDLITTIPGLISNNSNTLFEKNENYPSCYLTESVTKDGNKITVNLHNTAMFDSHSGVIRIMSLVQDVTEQKLIEQELIKAKESAEKADRLKSEFLAQMSHEIRTPINAMLSFTSLIKEDVAEYAIPDLEQSFEIINSAGNRIIRTTDLLINMAEIQTNTHDFNPHVIDIKDDIIQNLYPIFKPIAKKKNLELNFINKAEKSKVYADEYMLTKVFDNLIDNAVKFTNSGSVEILSSNISDSKIRIIVKDSGIGISEVYMKNLFKPFSQEESGYTRKFEGNGLGLALVKKYCDLNNADISVESEKGKGTSFILDINLA